MPLVSVIEYTVEWTEDIDFERTEEAEKVCHFVIKKAINRV